MKKELLGLTEDELREEMLALGEKGFRAGQIFSWLHKGASFEQMSNLSAALRRKLSENYIDCPVSIQEKYVSGIDGTIKLLFALRDGNIIEGVIMRYKYGCTLCISTQVGCKMGCRFCASTLEGCVRNLTCGEMLGQVLCANSLLGDEKIGHIVLMGSGEPLDNYEQVVRFLRLVSHKDGLNISLRHISLSTCGLVPQMYQLAEENLPVTLSVSLHAPSDEIRKQLMPIANRYSIEEVVKACRNYIEKTGRRVIFEYALVDSVNCSAECAVRLAGLLRGMQCHVNVIPLNTVKERNLYGVNENQVRLFLQTLENNHISATRRREMGDDIQGACGQLRKHYMAEADSEKNIQL